MTTEVMNQTPPEKPLIEFSDSKISIGGVHFTEIEAAEIMAELFDHFSEAVSVVLDRGSVAGARAAMREAGQ